MTDREFTRIVTYMANHYGIDLHQKRVIVEGRLDNYLQSKGYKSYDEYMNVIERDATGEEVQKIIDILTTNHTYFLREPEHFDYFRNVILPELKQREARTKNLRIWCAASSSGEEPYTIAMVMKDFFGLEYSLWDTVLLATDLSRQVLETAVHGAYPKQQVESLPTRWVKSNFRKVNDRQYEVKKEIREKVMFRQFNLMNPLPFRNKLHVVFLRNVMIYFDEETKCDLVNRIYEHMEPGGYLIVGMTESIDKDTTKFEYVGTSIYRKPLNGRE